MVGIQLRLVGQSGPKGWLRPHRWRLAARDINTPHCRLALVYRMLPEAGEEGHRCSRQALSTSRGPVPPSYSLRSGGHVSTTAASPPQVSHIQALEPLQQVATPASVLNLLSPVVGPAVACSAC